MTSDVKESEKEYLRQYDASGFDKPNTAVDTVILTVKDNALHVLLLKRTEHPFKSRWSLVGGFIDTKKDKDLEATAKRKLFEKTGVKTPYLEQFETIGNATRDPRGWSITTVYFALIPFEKVEHHSNENAEEIKWEPIENGNVKDNLAFDHRTLLTRCLERLRSKVLYTSLPVYLLPDKFTLGELKKVYEMIMATELERKSFYRRILSANILQETGEFRKRGSRPAKLYQLLPEHEAHFFSRNLEA